VKDDDGAEGAGEADREIGGAKKMPDQGSSDPADVLRLSRRSLGPFANLESDRERVRDGETSHRPHEGRAVARYRASHGVQTGDGGVEDLAAIARSEPVAESHRRCKIQRRNRRRVKLGTCFKGIKEYETTAMFLRQVIQMYLENSDDLVVKSAQ